MKQEKVKKVSQWQCDFGFSLRYMGKREQSKEIRMNKVNYYNEAEAQDAMSVIAKWMGKNFNLKVNFHNGTEVSADIFRGIINIPRLACSNGLDEQTLSLLRGRTYHEAGHIAETNLEKDDYPAGVLFEIFNAVEDSRMERKQGEKYPGAAMVFADNAKYYNRKIAGDVAMGKVNAPLWEGLVAMGLQSNCVTPAWRLSPKAQVYFDAGYDCFAKWKTLDDAFGSLVLAMELYEILKQAHEEYKQQQQQNEQGEEQEEADTEESEGKGQGRGQSDEDKEDGEMEESTGSPTDFDNEDNESSKSQAGDGEEDEDGEEEESDSEDGESSESDEDGEESDSEDGEESESESESDEDGEESKDGSEDDADGEEDGQSDSEPGDDDFDEDGSESGSSADDGDDDFEDEASDSSDSDDNAESKDYDTEYDAEDGDGEEDEEEETDFEAEMQEELEGGKDLEDYQNEDISDALDNLDPADKEYLSRRDLDEHNLIQGTDWDKEVFKQDREQIAAAVASMTRALEQAMRARTRCRKDRFQRRGKIDKTRLVQIAKSLSKEVFYKTQQGEDIDTAVSIVIDESGSMYGDTSLAVRRVAIAVGEALSKLNIPFEIVGSTTKYACSDRRMPPLNGLSRSNPIIYNHYKTFGQNWMTCCHNMSQSGAHNHNVDGEVVEYAVRSLIKRDEARKIVFSLCDGMPDAGHGNGHLMGRNITRTCERARKAGVEVYAFGINTSAPANYYGKDNFVELNGHELDTKFISTFVEIVSGGRFRVG